MRIYNGVERDQYPLLIDYSDEYLISLIYDSYYNTDSNLIASGESYGNIVTIIKTDTKEPELNIVKNYTFNDYLFKTEIR